VAKASSVSGSSSTRRKRAVPPSEKSTRKKLGAQEAPAQPNLLDDDTRRTIIGVVIAVAALALILIVAWPTNAVVTSFLSLWLRRLLGVGAYLLPIALIAVAGTFIARFERERVPTRSVIGLALILFGMLILLALFTPGAVTADGADTKIFAENEIIVRGGYVGAGPAYVLLALFGFAVSVVIAIGIMVVGLLVIGFSIRKLIATIKRKREELLAREEEEFGVAPDAPYVPAAVPARRSGGFRASADSSSVTQLIGRATARRGPSQPNWGNEQTMAFDDGEFDTVPFAEEPSPTRRRSPETTGQTRAITRKLGSRKTDTSTDGAAEGRKEKAVQAAKAERAEAPKTTSTETRKTSDDFELPKMSLLKVGKAKRKSKALENELAQTAGNLQQTMEDFGIMATVVDWVAGPTVTLFEVDLPPGVRVSRITNLQDDIALALAAPGVRIFAPVPGTHYVGIEVPNAIRENVLLGDVLKEVQGGPLELAIGKDVEGNAIVCDLAKMPHLLIGGTTGSGKSVGINAMIMSMLMRATPREVRFIMIDPKRVEFAPYDGIPHLYVPVVTEPKEAASALSWGVAEMERRLKLFSKVGVRNIGTFNEKVLKGEIEGDGLNGAPEEGDADGQGDGAARGTMPYIVIIIDELADLMMNVGKEVEFSISRIAQLARAAGIHLIVATQRPSANVVTGLIKANITNRMAFNVASGLDSRVILDTSGAESLIGNGDLLLSKPEYSKPVRIQGCFTSDEEIAAVVEAVKSQGEPDYHSEILQTNLISLGDTAPDGSGGSGGSDDPLIWEAAEIVVASGLGSTSNIQRKLKVGYSRAGRIMDMLEEKGIVGPPNGSKPRDVLVDSMELETLKAFEAADE